MFRSSLPEDERLSVEELVDQICHAGRKARHVGGADHIIETIIAERRAGDVVVIMPPLTITSGELERIVDALDAAIAEVCE